MLTRQQRLNVANAAQLTRLNTPPAPPPVPSPPTPSPTFAAFRGALRALVQELNAGLKHDLVLTVVDNDQYHSLGFSTVILTGGIPPAGDVYWLATDGTVRAGGGPYVQKEGISLGSATEFDIATVEERLLLEIDYASGEKIRPLGLETPPTAA